MDKTLFGTDKLVDKLKQVFMIHLKKFLPIIYNNVKERLKDCQDNLNLLGQNTSSMFNEGNKLSFINTLLNEYCELVDKTLSGKLISLSDNNINLQVRTCYVDLLSKYKYNYSPSKLINVNLKFLF